MWSVWVFMHSWRSEHKFRSWFSPLMGSGLCCKFFNPLNSFLTHDTALKQYKQHKEWGKEFPVSDA